MRSSGVKVLELGCGAGANIPLFQSLGWDYMAIEGSKSIVDDLYLRYPNMRDKIVCGDFTAGHPFGSGFDIVLDRAAVTHNNTESCERALRISFDSLKRGGCYIGVDWFSTSHTDYLAGSPVDDANTRVDIQNGSFTGLGKVHFSSRVHLMQLLRDFDVVVLEEKSINRFIPNDGHRFASWNFIGRKPNA
jgi:SAM-dependent methyltransferase